MTNAEKIAITEKLIELLSNDDILDAVVETDETSLFKDGDEYITRIKECGFRDHGVLYRGTSLLSAMEFLK